MAMLNSVMDAVENENFFNSVFGYLPQGFWYKRESWKTAKKIFGWKFDAWHCAKSLWIITMAWAIVMYQPVFEYKLLDVLLIGLIWNLVFVISYKFLVGKP